MLLTLLKGKIHRAIVTAVEPEYEGSCAIDMDWLDAAGILVNEQIHVYNMNNGERLVTYAIAAPRKSGIISLNGAAARKALAGDRVIIAAYAQFSAEEASYFTPKVFSGPWSA